MFQELFHDGGLYHAENSSLKSMDWFLYDRDLHHEIFNYDFSN